MCGVDHRGVRPEQLAAVEELRWRAAVPGLAGLVLRPLLGEVYVERPLAGIQHRQCRGRNGAYGVCRVPDRHVPVELHLGDPGGPGVDRAVAETSLWPVEWRTGHWGRP